MRRLLIKLRLLLKVRERLEALGYGSAALPRLDGPRKRGKGGAHHARVRVCVQPPDRVFVERAVGALMADEKFILHEVRS